MDTEEKSIVAHLRQDARVKLTTLSRKIGVPVSTLFDRIHSLDGLGIMRLTALLDFPALGYSTSAILLLKAGKNRRSELKEGLLKSECVNSLMRINNGYDFLAECVFKDLRELEEFCEKLEQKYGVNHKEVHFIVEELLREVFLNDPRMVPKNG